MGELIGQVNRDFKSGRMTPDIHFTKRDLVKLDRQARFLETSGIAEFLGDIVEQFPDTYFYYSDIVGIYPEGTRPGYVLKKGDELSVIISSSGTKLDICSASRVENGTVYRYDGPTIRPTNTTYNLNSTLRYFYTVGLLPRDEVAMAVLDSNH